MSNAVPSFSHEHLESLLTTRAIGRLAEFHDCIDSTNIRGKQLATSQSAHGTVIVANTQTAGRGRMTRVWQSPPDCNLYFSLVLFPTIPPQIVPQLALLCALGVHEAMSQTVPTHTFGLKWPNDLWSQQGRKLSGILCEAVLCGSQTAIVAGIGINVNGSSDDFPPDIRQTAGTLSELANHPLDRIELLAKFLNAFEPLLDQWQAAQSLQPFMDTWNKFDILRGTSIRVQNGDEIIEGIADGIRPDGRLVLSTPDGERLIHAGDTHILRNGGEEAN